MDQIQSFLEKIRRILLLSTGIILLLIIIATAILTFNLTSIDYPETPVLNDTISIADKQKQISNYKDLVSAVQAKQTNIYDFVVLKTLLDIFKSIIAALITYVFSQVGLQMFQIYRAEKNK